MIPLVIKMDLINDERNFAGGTGLSFEPSCDAVSIIQISSTALQSFLSNVIFFRSLMQTLSSPLNLIDSLAITQEQISGGISLTFPPPPLHRDE